MNRSLRNYFAAAMIFGVTGAQAGIPYPTAATPKAIDRGLMKSLASSSEISVTVALRPRDPNGAEELLSALTTPDDPQFHKFLTPQQFAAKFGPSAADVAKVIATLKGYGLRVEQATPFTLRATGTPAKIESAFHVSLHQFDVPAQGGAAAYSYHAPATPPTAPDAVAGLISGIVGLDTKPHFRPHVQKAPAELSAVEGQQQQSGNPSLINPLGSLTVADFAQYYDVKPLYAAGVAGNGRTLGIITLANFTPSDAFHYWTRVGLAVASNRMTLVNIDGGPGAPSDVSGSDETTLDVEQSGGLAPGARMIVYLAPNTNQAFFDAFAKAVNDNTADTVSVSWGAWEGFDQSTGFTNSLHSLLVQAAVQGQSFFAAAGDDGAYDVDRAIGVQAGGVTVDYPASDPAITAAGGTTLAGKQAFTVNGRPLVINVAKERVWGWDYLDPVCKKRKLDPIDCGIFSVGGGGGVSIVFGIPDYQTVTKRKGAVPIPGIKTSAKGETVQGARLPAGFQGRNVPDISANADPNTGYSMDYTSNIHGFRTTTFNGGTSFVAPQFNGVTALLCQKANSRLGLINNPLYSLVRANAGKKAGGPIRSIATGDNWFYKGAQGYSPAAGAGVLDVTKLATEPGF
ncbi:Peptidase S53 propeptide [Methylocella silvestris BL2]|uniref:Peptidase S53 propeptide n=1 Tax=Methylocella silvestris (strain DSM 15510 / CIP 108128 / LMG 27833 / NCIMB 13906 / BL2) TaxID=395965 RepID=B8ETI7_METSB|nr:protease pro-enzyme activation domain-containing protein [Methylocella silvestris]ACK52339.1 Peptidase S53 propeptide [Methylocella silvestris BL2]